MNPLTDPIFLFTTLGLVAGSVAGPALIWAAIRPPQGRAMRIALGLTGAVWLAFVWGLR